MSVWADYDPDATGWIDINQLLFLVYELPIPYGKGKISGEYTSEYDYDRVYDKLVHENLLTVRAQTTKNSEALEQNEIKQCMLEDGIYWINEAKGLIIKDTRTAAIVKDYNIPVYEDQKVHFKDVLQQLVKNAFDATEEEYLPDNVVQERFRKKWRTKKKKQVMLEMVDEFMGGRMLINKYRLIKQKREDKFNDVLDVNDAKFFTDRRDNTRHLQLPVFHQRNPFRFYKESESPRGKLELSLFT